ncbi:MAG TPA: nucleotidyltransferase family protein [Chloroflexota bacterium]|nr:nucleotidyltransferase family protein [Chloroflexota bacterium]
MTAIVAILLAAGESTRMGQLKALLPWGGTTLFEYQIGELHRSLVSETIVVLGHGAEQLDPLARPGRTRVIVNPNYRWGRSSSIRVGLQAIADEPAAIVVTSVDQPRPAAVIDSLVRDHLRRNGLITRPVYRAQHGHPPVFSGRLLPELRRVTEEKSGLKEVLQKHQSQVYDLDLDDPVVLLNLNSPQDYEAALRRDPSV